MWLFFYVLKFQFKLLMFPSKTNDNIYNIILYFIFIIIILSITYIIWIKIITHKNKMILIILAKYLIIFNL